MNVEVCPMKAVVLLVLCVAILSCSRGPAVTIIGEPTHNDGFLQEAGVLIWISQGTAFYAISGCNPHELYWLYLFDSTGEVMGDEAHADVDGWVRLAVKIPGEPGQDHVGPWRLELRTPYPENRTLRLWKAR